MADVSEPLVLSRSEPSEPKASILLVDDTPANLLSLRAILEDLGQNLVEARSGEEALQRVQADEFAVVLLDVLMPGISGFETARRSGATSAPGTRPSSSSPPATSTARKSEEAYRARRSGLPGEAAAAGRPPSESPGIRRTVPGQAAGEARGRPASAAGPRHCRLRHLHARPAGPRRHLERRGRAHQGLQGRGDHRPALLPLLPAGGHRPGLARPRTQGRRSGRPVRGRGLAVAEGRLPVLGQRRHHRPAGRAWRTPGLLEGHP